MKELLSIRSASARPQNAKTALKTIAALQKHAMLRIQVRKHNTPIASAPIQGNGPLGKREKKRKKVFREMHATQLDWFY